MTDAVLKWIGEVVAVGGPSAVIAFGLLKWLGQKWIDQSLSIQLERFKSEQQKELERLRHLLSSRIGRIHEKEFEVLPKAWFLLHDASGKAFHLMTSLKQYPDFARLPVPLFEEFLKSSRLSDSQRDELRQASDRNKLYAETMFWIEMSDAQVAQVAFHNYLVEHRIFMTEELRQKFGAVDSDLADALIEHRNWKRFTDASMFDASVAKITDVRDKISQVEEAVQKRLHYQEA